LVAIAIAVPFRNVGTSTFVDLTRSVAHAARVILANTFIDVVADAVQIGVGLTRTNAFTKGVKLVAVAVAVPFRNVGTSTFVDLTRPIAHTASVEFANTWVNVVADAIRIGVGLTRTVALAKGVELVAVAVAIASWDVGTSTVVNRTRTVADAAVVNHCRTTAYTVAIENGT
jgi:hypothetical protein